MTLLHWRKSFSLWQLVYVLSFFVYWTFCTVCRCCHWKGQRGFSRQGYPNDVIVSWLVYGHFICSFSSNSFIIQWLCFLVIIIFEGLLAPSFKSWCFLSAFIDYSSNALSHWHTSHCLEAAYAYSKCSNQNMLCSEKSWIELFWITISAGIQYLFQCPIQTFLTFVHPQFCAPGCCYFINIIMFESVVF